jgi:hypothetical protein
MSGTKPVDCISITNFYPRAPDDVTYYSFGNPIELFYDYMPYFRGFIPPGTVIIDLLILENGKQMAVARHKIPPTGLPQFPPTGYIPDNRYKLSEFEEKDQWTIEQESFLYIAYDSFSPIDISRAGWLYVKVGGGSYSPNYSTQFSVRVDTKTYNAWWDKYIGSAANWKALIEDVETYDNPTPENPLTVTPLIQTVSYNAGTTTFSVVGNYVAAVGAAASDWLSITSGASGTNPGTINCFFNNNTGDRDRSGTITITPTDGGDPVDVKVRQLWYQRDKHAIAPPIAFVLQDAGTFQFGVNTDSDYVTKIETSSSWLSIMPATERKSFDCAFINNTSDSVRLGIISVTFTDGGVHYVEVRQFPDANTPLIALPLILTVQKHAGAIATFIVNKGVNALITSSNSWMRNSGDSLPGTVAYRTVEANTGADRSATIRLSPSNGGDPIVVTLIQAGTAGISGQVTPLIQTVSKDAGTTTFSVVGAYTTKLETGASWLSIASGDKGTTSGTISCKFTANTGTSARSGTIRVTATDGDIVVTVDQAGTTVILPPPPIIPNAQKVVNEMVSRLSDTIQAKKNVDDKIKQISDFSSAVTSVGSQNAKLIAANKAAKTIEYFIKNKVSGSFGGYGIESQKTLLGEMSQTMGYEIAFYKSVITMYNQIDKGYTSLNGLDFPPGFDKDTFPDGFPASTVTSYKPDNDDPMSKFMLKKTPDLRMQNRPDHSLDPLASGMICVQGIVYVATFDINTRAFSGYYPVGLQQPPCKPDALGRSEFDRSHVSTKAASADETKRYLPLCKDIETE